MTFSGGYVAQKPSISAASSSSTTVASFFESPPHCLGPTSNSFFAISIAILAPLLRFGFVSRQIWAGILRPRKGRRSAKRFRLEPRSFKQRLINRTQKISMRRDAVFFSKTFSSTFFTCKTKRLRPVLEARHPLPCRVGCTDIIKEHSMANHTDVSEPFYYSANFLGHKIERDAAASCRFSKGSQFG